MNQKKQLTPDKMTKKIIIAVIAAIISSIVGGYFYQQQNKNISNQQNSPIINNLNNSITLEDKNTKTPKEITDLETKIPISNINTEKKQPIPVNYPEKKSENKLIEFILKNCQLSGNNLKIKLIVQNKDNDQRVSINNLRIISTDGIEYVSYKVDIAKTNQRTIMMPSGIPMIVDVDFDDINEKLNDIAILEIAAATTTNKTTSFTIQLRDIPVF